MCASDILQVDRTRLRTSEFATQGKRDLHKSGLLPTGHFQIFTMPNLQPDVLVVDCTPFPQVPVTMMRFATLMAQSMILCQQIAAF